MKIRAEREWNEEPGSTERLRDSGPPLEAKRNARAIREGVKHWRWMIAPPLLLAVVLGLTGALRDQRYTSTAEFVIASRSTQPQLAGLAAQLALPMMSTSDPLHSADLIVHLLRAPEFLRDLTDSSVAATVGAHAAQRRIADFLEVKPAPAPLRSELVARAMARLISASSEARTGLISLSVTSPDPVFAQSLAAALIRAVDRLTTNMRQQSAETERVFASRQLEDARANVNAAEQRLQNFLEANQDFRSSSRLTIEQERLMRDVQLNDQMYVSLAQQYEQAHIDEARDTPAISVVIPPPVPAIPNSRGVVRLAVLGLIGGSLLSLALLLLVTNANELDWAE